MKRSISILCLFLLLVLAPFPASHALMKKVAFTTLVESSPHIVRGTVTDMTSYWGDDHRAIYTDVALSVFTQFKGDPVAKVIMVRIMGGLVDDIGLTVEDMPRFSPGEDVILFLSPRGDAFEVKYLFQGKYTVEDETVLEARAPVTEFVASIFDAIDASERQ